MNYVVADLDGANSFRKPPNHHSSADPRLFSSTGVHATIWSFRISLSHFTVSVDGSGSRRFLLFYGLYLYQNGFKFLKMGYASAMAWLLFIVVMILTIIILKSSKSWVNYGS